MKVKKGEGHQFGGQKILLKKTLEMADYVFCPRKNNLLQRYINSIKVVKMMHIFTHLLVQVFVQFIKKSKAIFFVFLDCWDNQGEY